MSSKRKISLMALRIILITGMFFIGQLVPQLGKIEVYKPDFRPYKKIAEPKYRPINPPLS